MQKGKIFFLMGKSTSGKDTIYKNLIEDKALLLKKIVPYTTRPMRDGEKDGVQYFFKKEDEYKKLREEGKIIEERTYHTNYGEWRYFTVDDGQIDLENGNYLVIGTLESYCSFRNFVGEENLVPLLIDVSAKKRLERAMHREEKQATPRYDEMCRRFLADEEDFAEKKIEEAGVNYRFSNNADIESCIEAIKSHIVACINSSSK